MLTRPGPRTEYERQADRVLALLQGKWGVMMLLTVSGLAFVWGAMHALMPGHAKTVVAAYLISQHGTYWHAVLLAIIVTVTHTALVVLLGLVIYVYQGTNPTLGPRLQNWLGLLCGLLIAGMGATLIWRALTGRLGPHHDDHHHHDDEARSWLRKLFTHSHPHVPEAGHTHDHGHHHHHADDEAHGHSHHHDHPHDHDDTHSHEHDHGHAHEHAHALDNASRSTPAGAQRLTTRLVLILGISGGIVPCPTATIIMFMGIGANVVLGALYVIGVFSLGMSLSLMLVGFLALSSRRFAAKVLSDAQHEGELSGRGRWLLLRAIPVVSGSAVVTLGGLIAANYVYRIETGQPLVTWLG
jgi:ABC-type nickel/cobalt efflux system permease component RcnA